MNLIEQTIAAHAESFEAMGIPAAKAVEVFTVIWALLYDQAEGELEATMDMFAQLIEADDDEEGG